MRIQLYSDETKAKHLNFIITTYIWGKGEDCRLFEEEVAKLINLNQPSLGGNFSSFHANRLGINNWSRLSKYYLQVIKILFNYVKENKFRLLIFIESNEERDAAWVNLEDKLDKVLNDPKPSEFNYVFGGLSPRDRLAIKKSSFVISGYILNMHVFGNNLKIEYFPAALGTIMHFRNKKLLLKSFTLIGEQAEFPFYEIIRRIMNILGRLFQRERLKVGRTPVVNNNIINFQPIKASDSFILQTADIISNFFYNLVQFAAGERNETVRRKALTLLGFSTFRANLGNFKASFTLKNGIPFCINPKLEARLDFFAGNGS